MAYSLSAIEKRRCKARRKDGGPCMGWAMWGDPLQRCAQHAGRGHRGPLNRLHYTWPTRAQYEPCRCVAYAWPHRPGGGLCQWPDEPKFRRTTPAGTRSSSGALMRDWRRQKGRRRRR